MSTDTPEFVGEAQEIVDTFSRSLLTLEEAIRENQTFDPDVLNAAFRAIHTLKGLAALAGGGHIASLSHVLESVLDELRLGRRPLDQAALDILFEAVEVYGRLLGDTARGDEDDRIKVGDEFLFRIREFLDNSERVDEGNRSIEWLDETIGAVLTEYEEHRLRENVRQNKTVYRVHASFAIMEIDTGIDALKARLKPLGEVITYLPSAESSNEDCLELDIILGSMASMQALRDSVADSQVEIEALSPRQGEAAASGTAAEIPKAHEQAPEPPSVPVKQPEPEPEPKPDAIAQDAASPVTEAVRLGTASVSETERKGETASPDQETQDLTLRSVSQTVRVDLRRLDGLMTWVGELGVVFANFTDMYDQALGLSMPHDLIRGFRDELRTMERTLNSLREGILEVRMVPLGHVFDRLARVVRNAGREAGKQIRLKISGAETELDKLIMEELSDPLMHMVRNSIDHGIEAPAEREAANKDPVGHIKLRAFQKGNRVVIEIVDDGRGIDWRKIREIAIRRGFISASDAEEMTPTQCINLIFEPGFSTRSSPTQLSGRGVGMDVVQTNIARLSGMIDIHSEVGQGSRFSITLPVTLALIQALVIRVSRETYCVPLASVLESLMLEKNEIRTIEGFPVILLRGQTLPLVYLSDIFDLETGATESDLKYVVVVGSAQHRIGLVVDDLIGQRDVVIKPLGRALSGVPGIAGATELRANRTVLLLDVAKLVTESIESGGARAA